MKKEGSVWITETYRSCLNYKYHESEMIRSGRHPLRHHFCLHPEVKELHAIKEGKFIGEKPKTPNWCPIN